MLVGDRVDLATSRHLPSGGAGVFVALLDAAHRIERGEAGAVMVVGADSLLDLARLDALQQERRLLVDDVMDGFIAGEGAAALVVSAVTPGALATVAGVGAGDDPFRHEGDAPLTGDGLTSAVQTALAGATAPVGAVWADLNGEAWTAREWGLAARRSHRSIAPDAAVHHPAEFYGHPGAAAGAMLLTLAAMGLYRGVAVGSSLVWGLSDGGLRGAARLERSG
jgi:3-oxoacyl-[acyl-carrier-protein] synthase-1